MTLSVAEPEFSRKSDGRRNGTSCACELVGIALAILAPLLLPVLGSGAASQREDNVRLNFQKTAGLRQTRVYIVKKGDFLSGIFRSQQGDEPVPYALIRRLNPRIKNLNRIYPGQRIVLPTREKTSLSEASDTIRPKGDSSLRTYAIKEGDSISRIILAELDVGPDEVLPTYRLLRQMNPGIADLNQLTPGQFLTLPPDASRPPPPVAEPIQTIARPEEKTLAAPLLKTPPTAEGLLGYIRPVINRMRGTLTTGGNYFIPLKDAAQVTIDCSLIPVVELDDGSTMLLDFGNRLSDALKDLIGQSWPNYAFLSAEELRDNLASLQGIIRRSRNYTMTAVDKPLALILSPEILVFPDWIIAGKKATGGALYRQGLFFLGMNERPIPPEARIVMEKNGFVVTEIADGAVVASLEPAMAASVPDLRGLKGVAFAEQLLKALGETPIRGSEVVLFDSVRDGFNLTILADLLLQKDDKRLIIHTKKLPEQFIRILREEGTEVILIAESASGRSLAEGLLQGLKMPFSFGHFSFRIPHEGNRPRLTTAFPALRVMTRSDVFYLIDFDVPPDVLSLLQGRQGQRIGKY